MIPQISVLVNSFQFLTEEDLSIFADQHDLELVNAVTHINSCQDALLGHCCGDACERQSYIFKQLDWDHS
jgi:hypothetical protein